MRDPAGRWSALRARLRLRWPKVLARFAPTERQQLFALTVVVGGACGLAAVAFHLSIELVSRLAIDRALAAPGRAWIPWTLPATDAAGRIVGFVDETSIAHAYANARRGRPPG